MPVTSFTANPERIKKGQSSTLKWTTDGCSDCFVNPPLQGEDIPPNGEKEVKPELSTVYRIECKCSEEPNYWTVLVEVDES